MKKLLLLTTMLIVACAGSQPGADDPCKDFDLDVKKTEIAGIRARVDLAVKQFGGEIEAQRSEEIVTGMDRATRQWVMNRYAVCRDHLHRHLGTPEDYNAKVTCLDAFRERLLTLVTALEAGNENALGSVDALQGEVDQCKR